MTVLAYADAESAVKVWARAEAGLVAVVAHRTFLGLPDKYLPSEKGPAISFSMIGGAPDGTTPLDLPQIQFSCWGATRAEAGQVRTALIGALHSLTRITVTTDTGDVTLADARVLASFFRPDAAGDPVFPRYIVTALIAVLPA